MPSDQCQSQPRILVLGRLRQEDSKFKTSPDYIARLWFWRKRRKKKWRKKGRKSQKTWILCVYMILFVKCPEQPSLSIRTQAWGGGWEKQNGGGGECWRAQVAFLRWGECCLADCGDDFETLNTLNPNNCVLHRSETFVMWTIQQK